MRRRGGGSSGPSDAQPGSLIARKRVILPDVWVYLARGGRRQNLTAPPRRSGNQMPTYPHFQETKKAEPLPEKQNVGACLTCQYWAVETPRLEAVVQLVGLCVQPELKNYALIVSGSSACNKWKEQTEAGPEAKAYAERGEQA